MLPTRMPKGAEKSRKSHRAMSHPDALIAPEVRDLAQGFSSGRIPWDEPIEIPQAPLPPELVPFLESLSLARLVDVLKKRPGLYWHPVVVVQAIHLWRLLHDEAQWHDLGWKYREHEGRQLPPEEVDTIDAYLLELIETHAHGLFPGSRIQWKSARRRSGPRPGVSESFRHHRRRPSCSHRRCRLSTDLEERGILNMPENQA
jgi:hypothetical protein